MANAFDIIRAIENCARRITVDNGFNTDAGLVVRKNVGKFSKSDPHPLIFINYPGADKTAEYPGQVRQEKAGEFQVSMEYAVGVDDELEAAEAAYQDLTRALFGADSPRVPHTLVSSCEFAGESHIARMPGGEFGQMHIHLLIRWIESVGQE